MKPAAFSIGRIDDVIHGRLRLGIMAYLAHVREADFTTLKAKLEAADGNLSVQLRKLQDAGFISIDKSFKNNKPLTRARLTSAGRKAFLAYLDEMTRLVEEAGEHGKSAHDEEIEEAPPLRRRRR